VKLQIVRGFPHPLTPRTQRVVADPASSTPDSLSLSFTPRHSHSPTLATHFPPPRHSLTGLFLIVALPPVSTD